MQDLYKGFKKTAEDDRHAVLEHESGHTLHVAKSGLSKKHLQQLSKLPLHQAEGSLKEEEQLSSTVNPEAQSVGAQIAQDFKQELTQGAANATSVETGEPVQKFVGKTPPEKRPMPVPLYTAFVPHEDQPPDMPGSVYAAQKQKEYDDYIQREKELKEMEGRLPGIEAGSTTITDKSVEQPEEQAGLSQPTRTPTTAPQTGVVEPTQAVAPQAEVSQAVPVDPMEVLLNPKATPSQKYQAYLISSERKRKEREEFDRKFYEDMKNQEIKAPELLHDKSTLGKIGAVMAMALSGIGAGVTGKENMVMQLLNDRINKEIDAQKRSEERTFNLHKFHSEQMGNSALADLQTANDLLNLSKLQLDEQIMGAPNSPMAKLRAQTYRKQMEAQQAEYQDKIAKMQTDLQMRQGMLKPSKSTDPSLIVPPGIPEKQAHRVDEEIKHRMEINKIVPKLLYWFDKIDSLEYTPGATQAFQGLLTTLVPKIEGTVAQGALESTREKYTPKKFNPLSPGANKAIRKSLLTWAASTSDDSAFRRATGGRSLDEFDKTAHSWAEEEKPVVQTNEITRFDPKSGKKAVFDANTKTFIRWAD